MFYVHLPDESLCPNEKYLYKARPKFGLQFLYILTTYTDVFPGGILAGERKTRKETRRLSGYLFGCSSGGPCLEGGAGHAGGRARSPADGGLLLDPVSPFPSLLRPDLGGTGHRRFSHLRLRGGHVALLLPRGRHFGALAHGGGLGLPHG